MVLKGCEKMKNEIIESNMLVKENKIHVIRINNQEYISLTDLARSVNADSPADVVKNWLRNKVTISFLGVWEELNNKNFKLVEFDQFKNEAGRNAFTMSPQKWIKNTNAIGIVSKSGKYGGGTFAHSDIAFEFASWISPEFKLYLIKEFERLKRSESYQYKINWSASRILSKANYKIHTDAIKNNIIPKLVTENQKKFAYPNEADLLNVALFGKTAKQWREENPNLKGNMRDYADIKQLLVLCNIENINAEMINEKIPQNIRLEKLNNIAIRQMKILENDNSIEQLKKLEEKNDKLIETK